MATRKTNNRNLLMVRALRTEQREGIDVYCFFMAGIDITRVADISRVERAEDDSLKGFQRREIRNHVRQIAQYLNQGNVLFPNAIILAMSRDIRFVQSRGPRPQGLVKKVHAGMLTIPIRKEGERVAWIVDGQQRSLALAECSNRGLVVPVVGFLSDDIQVQREQFILVNKAKPLPNRLINELLPETGAVMFPRELASRKIPMELCNLLNRDQKSPFYGMIKRLSERDKSCAVITDSAIVRMIRNSINNPLGALSPYKTAGSELADIPAMYRTLLNFWTAVQQVFSAAWGLPSTKSRLMHSAGIEAMGVLMDRMYARHAGKADEQEVIRKDLEQMEPYCHWTEGEWETLGLAWNEIQQTPRHVRTLADTLVRIYTSRVPR